MQQTDRMNNEYNMHKWTKTEKIKTEINAVTQLKTNPGDRHHKTAYW